MSIKKMMKLVSAYTTAERALESALMDLENYGGECCYARVRIDTVYIIEDTTTGYMMTKRCLKCGGEVQEF